MAQTLQECGFPPELITPVGPFLLSPHKVADNAHLSLQALIDCFRNDTSDLLSQGFLVEMRWARQSYLRYEGSPKPVFTAMSRVGIVWSRKLVHLPSRAAEELLGPKWRSAFLHRIGFYQFIVDR